MNRTCLLTLVSCVMIATLPKAAAAQEQVPTYLRDRGTGQPTSMFGTYLRRGDVLVYPFFEYYHDNNYEYKPAEFGYTLDQDFRGKFRATEGLLFVAFGLTDWLGLEFEAAVLTARLDKAPNDPSAMPARLEESGLGDVEGQVRARFMRENERRPELFGYFEWVSPNRDKVLIGTADWELKTGVGMVRGFSWGTLTARIAAEYPLEEGRLLLGEYALEYLKRLSPAWRVYLGVEGTQDEVGVITEVQWHLADFAYLKINNSFGLTSKATDWAPEIGILFLLSRGRR